MMHEPGAADDQAGDHERRGPERRRVPRGDAEEQVADLLDVGVEREPGNLLRAQDFAQDPVEDLAEEKNRREVDPGEAPAAGERRESHDYEGVRQYDHQRV